MATALYSPERAVGASPIHLVEGAGEYLDLDDTQSASLADGASAIGSMPPPNPHFVFPAAPPSPSTGSSSFVPPARRRRPLSAVETHTRSFSIAVETADRIPRHAALPDFSFNPGASLPPDPRTLLSPPVSPISLNNLPSPSRPMGHGHRRGGSEFVGGRLREGSSIAVLGTSPTKSESGFTTPTLQPPPPRRGHRRGVSGAISTNDLPVISPPFDSPWSQASSSPNSPAKFEVKDELPITGDEQLVSLPAPVLPAVDHTLTDAAGESTPQQTPVEDSVKLAKPIQRVRVGFSDTLEYIPRPLSLVSSDTSSTTTARPGHSVSDSISSIISLNSISGRDSPLALSRTPTSDLVESRPSTAGAILERTTELQVVKEPPISPRRRNSIPALLDATEVGSTTPTASSPTKPAKRWSFFGLDAFTSGSPTKGRPGSSSSTESAPKVLDAGSCSDNASDSSNDRVQAAPEKQKKPSKKTNRKRRVKGWAGAILPRKPKVHKKRAKSNLVRPPTPPAPLVLSGDEEDEEIPDPEFQEPEVTTPTVLVTEPFSRPVLLEPAKRTIEDASLAMIDLDAALGPFNTPLSYNPEWEAAQQAAGNSTGRRRLHSAQGMKGFSGPGMHYHRRAESAPALPPFDPGRAGIHRFGSSSTMADVFEEDEEDEEDNGDEKSKTGSGDESEGEATPPAVAVPAREPFSDIHEKSSHMVRRRSSGLSDRESMSAHSLRAEVSRTSLQEEVIVEEPQAPIFRASMTFQSSRDSFDSGAPSPRANVGTCDLLPVEDFPLNPPGAGVTPISPYSMSHTSSHPSPRSPMSMDAQRISTAPSSVTDDSFHSLLMGEPGPEVRISMDYDIPSLTSSTSTMTRDSTFAPLPRPRPVGRREQRPASVSSAALGRRRSSLVSLSRLISSSHGERSKLSMEVTLDNEAEPKKTKQSKTKRLSRMMQFWKPNKDGSTT